MRVAAESNKSTVLIGDPTAKLPGLRELCHFRSVAQAGNFGRAARDLAVSQPSVSRTVQSLENQLGKQLLIRHGRGVTLTEAGSSLLQRLDVILNLLAQPLETAQADAQASRPLVFGVVPELAPALVPALVDRANRHWPERPFTVREAVSANLEEQLVSKRIDMAILQDPPVLDSICSEPVLYEPLGMVVGARSALASMDGPVQVRQLAQLPLILPDPMHWIRRKVETAAFQRGARLRVALQVDSLALAKEAVRTGIGCAVLPYATVQDEVARGTLGFVPIVRPDLVVVHAVAWRPDAQDGYAARFAAEVRTLMTSLVEAQQWPGARLIATTRPAIAAE